MSGEEEWAFEGRMISRKAYTERNPKHASEVSLQLQASSDETVERRFKRYLRVFELTDTDLAEDKSICVIGAGDNAFAAGLKDKYPDGKHAFVMGVDPAEKRYRQLDPKIINHDARALGFPSDFEGFDLVVSMHAVPKYFLMWASPQDNRDEVIAHGSDMFDYDVADREASDEEIEEAMFTAFTEMLRITKPGGKVKMYPLQVARWGMPTYDNYVLMGVFDRLSKEFPGIEMHLVPDNREKKSEGGIIIPEKEDQIIMTTIEIIRPFKNEDSGSA